MDELTAAISKVIERRNGEKSISPSWVAHEAMLILDPNRDSVPAVYEGCNLMARQLARGQLRRTCDPADANNPQFEMFSGLQSRYPVERKPGEEPSYVLLEALSEADVGFNVSRFSAVSEALAKHAAALQAWWDNRPPGRAA